MRILPTIVIVILLLVANTTQGQPKEGSCDFGVEQIYSVGSGPVGEPAGAVAVADFNNDGHQDLAVNNGNGSTFTQSISVLINAGDGTFGEPFVYLAGELPTGISAGDLDGDSDQDLAIANNGSNFVSLLMNDGDGTFTTVNIDIGVSQSAISIADFDGDLDMDIAAASGGNATVNILLNKGGGTFDDPISYEGLDAVLPVSMVAADFDGDEDIDLVQIGGGYSGVILRNHGNAFFFPPIDIGSTHVLYNPTSVSAGDYDADGDIDLLWVRRTSDQVVIRNNNGLGVFSSAASSPINYNSSDQPVSATFGDVDGDMDLDIIVALLGTDEISIVRNDGSGNYLVDQNRIDVGPEPRHVTVGDLDGNASIDVVVSNAELDLKEIDHYVSVFVNQCLLLGDVNLDGLVDLLDVAPFVEIVSSGEYQAEADVNQDEVVNLLDVQPFVEILTGD